MQEHTYTRAMTVKIGERHYYNAYFNFESGHYDLYTPNYTIIRQLFYIRVNITFTHSFSPN